MEESTNTTSMVGDQTMPQDSNNWNKYKMKELKMKVYLLNTSDLTTRKIEDFPIKMAKITKLKIKILAST